MNSLSGLRVPIDLPLQGKLGKNQNGKKTCEKRWQDPDHPQPALPDGCNVGLRLEHYVDIDLDSDEARKMASALLLLTDRQHARPSRGVTHYWYVAPSIRSETFLDTNGKPLLEIRAGHEQYTVLPPSTVLIDSDDPSRGTEDLFWAAEGDPAPVDADGLRRSVVDLATAALVVRHWPKGQRHFTLMHLAGFLARRRTRAETEAILSEITRVAEGTAWSEVRGLVESTYSKKDDGQITGAPSLEETLGKDVVRLLLRWFEGSTSGSGHEDRLAALNESYSILHVGNRVVVAEFHDGRIVELWPFDEFKRKLIKEPPAGKAPFADFWLRHPQGRKHNRLVYVMPGSREQLRDGDFNGWQGFTVEPAPGDWSQNREHIRQVICAGDERIFEWLMNWLAALFQMPGQHAWSSPMLYGGQGTGKGHFADFMIGQCFHRPQYLHIVGANQLTAEFNEHFSGVVFIFGDETVWGGAKEAAEKLKGLITEDTVIIHRKFLKAVEEPSALHIIMASNSDWPVQIPKDDRRFLVLEVSDARRQDQAYFDRLRAELSNGGRAAMLHDLLHSVVDHGALRHPPDTDAKRQVKARTFSPEEMWIQNWLMNVDGTWTNKIAKGFLYSLYKLDLPRNVTARSIEGFGRIFKKVGITWTDGKDKKENSGQFVSTTNCYVFPSLSVCRAAFDQALGVTTDWPTDGDDAVPGIEPRLPGIQAAEEGDLGLGAEGADAGRVVREDESRKPEPKPEADHDERGGK